MIYVYKERECSLFRIQLISVSDLKQRKQGSQDKPFFIYYSSYCISLLENVIGVVSDGSGIAVFSFGCVVIMSRLLNFPLAFSLYCTRAVNLNRKHIKNMHIRLKSLTHHLNHVHSILGRYPFLLEPQPAILQADRAPS